MRLWIIRIISVIFSLYFAVVSIVLVKILTNDIVLNSYSFYENTKLNTNKIISNSENIYQKSKIFLNKVLDKEKGEKLEENYKKEILERQKILLKQKENIERNKFILFIFPYILSIIIFIFFYVKIKLLLEKFISNL